MCEIENYGFKYEIVKGVGEERYKNALNIVNKFIKYK